MTTTYLKLPGGNRIAVPRGAVWGASLFARLLRPLQVIGQRRAEKALLEMADNYQSTQPSLAADYREAALRARSARLAMLSARVRAYSTLGGAQEPESVRAE